MVVYFSYNSNLAIIAYTVPLAHNLKPLFW